MTTACLEVEGQSVILDLFKSASALSSPTLDLSRRNISKLPDVFPPCPRLEVSTCLIPTLSLMLIHFNSVSI